MTLGIKLLTFCCTLQFLKYQFFFNLFWRTWVFFVGPLIPLFWTPGDVSGFQNQSDSLIHACQMHTCYKFLEMNSPLVWHLLTSWCMATGPTSSTNLRAGIGRAWNQDLLCPRWTLYRLCYTDSAVCLWVFEMKLKSPHVKFFIPYPMHSSNDGLFDILENA